MIPIRTRFAPTPSGFLHIGNALSFVMTWALARAHKGWILLRIDDLDAGRRRLEYLEDIFRTIEWLGLDYDAGPGGPDDFLLHYSQQFRLPLYQEALQQLKEQGDLYACTCSRKQIMMLSADGKYPGTCRNLQKSFEAPQTAWRIRLAEPERICFNEWKKGQQSLDLNKLMGDFVIRQKNALPAYQIASLIDDRHWEINFIVRGADLKPSTAAQIYLSKRLDLVSFQDTIFWHHELVTAPDGHKLSKSRGADALKNWREQGKSPAPIFKMAAQWLGLADSDITSANAIAAALSH